MEKSTEEEICDMVRFLGREIDGVLDADGIRRSGNGEKTHRLGFGNQIHTKTGEHGGRTPLHRSDDTVGEGIAKRFLLHELDLVCIVVDGMFKRIY